MDKNIDRQLTKEMVINTGEKVYTHWLSNITNRYYWANQVGKKLKHYYYILYKYIKH